jgi:hypothetical protein
MSSASLPAIPPATGYREIPANSPQTSARWGRALAIIREAGAERRERTAARQAEAREAGAR